MKMILEVNYPDDLNQADVLSKIQNGIRYFVGVGDPRCLFNQELAKVKIKKVRKSTWEKFIKP